MNINNITELFKKLEYNIFFIKAIDSGISSLSVRSFIFL